MIRAIGKTDSAKFNYLEEDATQAVQRIDGDEQLTYLRRIRNTTGKKRVTVAGHVIVEIRYRITDFGSLYIYIYIYIYIYRV